MRRDRGVTLVETMVGILITAILAGMAVGLGSDFTNQAARREAREQLVAGFQKARSLAARNVSALASGVPGTLFCLGNDHVLRVFVRNDTASPAVSLPAACESNSGTPVWSAAVKGGVKTLVELSPGGSAWSCLALDRSGEKVSHSMGSTNCSTQANVSVTRGDKSLSFNWLNGQ